MSITVHCSRSKWRPFRRVLTIGCLLLPGVILACRTTEQMAPPVTEQYHAIAEDQGFQGDRLEPGRRLYLTDCARCHNVEPIDRYSVQEWEEIIPDMAEVTSLNEEEVRSLRAYILTARKAMTQEAPSAGGR